MTARRIVSVFLPSLAMERWQRGTARSSAPFPADLPAVLVDEDAHGPVIHALNRAAAMLGVRQGARLADMRALCPDIHVEQCDRAGDAAALERLMLWLRRWGPWSAVDGEDGLVLDATGSAHLFGGEAAMLADMQGRMGVAGLTARLAVAPTWGAAWGLARYGAERAVVEEGAPPAMLMALPTAALRIADETQLLLRRLGLKTIGDVAAIPRLPMARRFARAALEANPLMRLDQMTGRLAEPLQAPDAPPVFVAVARLAEPVQDPTDWLPGLMADLCAQLGAQDRGCRRIRLTVFRVDGERREVAMGTAAPSRDAAHLLRLFDGRLEGLDPGYGFDLITLEALAVEGLGAARPRLDGGRDGGLARAQLIDRLIARFGAAAVILPEAVESHIPERAERPTPAIVAGAGRLSALAPPPLAWREAEAGRLATGTEVRVAGEGARADVRQAPPTGPATGLRSTLLTVARGPAQDPVAAEAGDAVAGTPPHPPANSAAYDFPVGRRVA